MCALNMRIVAYVSSISSICIFAFFQPIYNLLLLLFLQFVIKHGESSQSPIGTIDFQVFSEKFAFRVEIFAFVQVENIFYVLFSAEMCGLAFHSYLLIIKDMFSSRTYINRRSRIKSFFLTKWSWRALLIIKVGMIKKQK